ncbi:MAG: patatin-like phospholipase family protein [Deltaproteobacteria bacterium]|nr:patatin-like phospholipase family protein [Deltaproteobacteria bacterium]
MAESPSRKPNKTQIPRKSKTAFVCSGGAAKAGAFHLGVALALQEKGFRFKGGLKHENASSPEPAKDNQAVTVQDSAGREISIYVGSSAGSIICAYLACGYSLSQVIDTFVGKKKSEIGENEGKLLKRLTYTTMFAIRKDIGLLGMWNAMTDKSPENESASPAIGRFISLLAKGSYENIFKWKWLKLSGIFSTSGIERYMREDVLPSNDFQNYASDLFVVATQLNHSKKVVFGKYNYSPPNDDKTVVYTNTTSIADACAASTALPPIYTPYPIENERGHKVYYFDGEIRDTLSTHVGFDAGADLIISSYSHQPYHFSREIGSLHQFGIPSIMIQAIYLLVERKIQAAITTQERNKAAIDATSRFFKENNLPDELRLKCLDLLERKLGYKSGVDYIYIHPHPNDHQMFFGDHFNLTVSKMGEIVKLGFRCAVDVLRRYEFE